MKLFEIINTENEIKDFLILLETDVIKKREYASKIWHTNNLKFYGYVFTENAELNKFYHPLSRLAMIILIQSL